jgi:hypothetical protein
MTSDWVIRFFPVAVVAICGVLPPKNRRDLRTFADTYITDKA